MNVLTPLLAALLAVSSLAQAPPLRPSTGPAGQSAPPPSSQRTPGPSTQQATTQQAATTQAATQPRLSAEAEMLLKAAIENTKYLALLIPKELKEAQAELSWVKAGPVQVRAGKPDVERVVRANGRPVYLFNTGKARLEKAAEFQSKIDDLNRRQKELNAGKLLLPNIDFGSPAIGMAGKTNGTKAKIIRIMSRDQAIMGYGTFRYWVHGLNTKDWIEGAAEPLPDLAAITASTSYLELTEGQMKTVFVLRGVKPFDLEAEAQKNGTTDVHR